MRDLVEQLKAGKTVTFRPSGHSMAPYINHRDQVTVKPLTELTALDVGDIVLCKVDGRFLLHRIGAVRWQQYRIENARGHVNGWITRRNIFGFVTDITT